MNINVGNRHTQGSITKEDVDLLPDGNILPTNCVYKHKGNYYRVFCVAWQVAYRTNYK